MRKLLSTAMLGLVATAVLAEETPKVLSFSAKTITGENVDLTKYKGKVLLVVNVASYCGYTNQYEGLQALHEKYGDKGLAVLGFPCNQFGKQEPKSEGEIQEFCKTKFKVGFDMFSKVDVNGDEACDLYKHLTSKESDPDFAGPVKWNFEKFLISKDGKIVGRYRSAVKPESTELTKAIETELGK
ncbi:glutathione peroxidase [bacterium]|nr:glutathione peroxidase [bacterium]